MGGQEEQGVIVYREGGRGALHYVAFDSAIDVAGVALFTLPKGFRSSSSSEQFPVKVTGGG